MNSDMNNAFSSKTLSVGPCPLGSVKVWSSAAFDLQYRCRGTGIPDSQLGDFTLKHWCGQHQVLILPSNMLSHDRRWQQSHSVVAATFWTDVGERQSITRKGVRAIDARNSQLEHASNAAKTSVRAPGLSTDEREHPFVWYFGAGWRWLKYEGFGFSARGIWPGDMIPACKLDDTKAEDVPREISPQARLQRPTTHVYDPKASLPLAAQHAKEAFAVVRNLPAVEIVECLASESRDEDE